MAAIKAARFGIALYDFKELTDEEITSWIGVTKVRARFLQFQRLEINATVPSGTIIGMSAASKFETNGNNSYQTVLALIRDAIADKPMPMAGSIDINPPGFLIEGVAPVAISCIFEVDMVTQHASCTSVRLRDHPEKPAVLRDVSVQRFDHSVREIITHDENFHLAIDVDNITSPDNAILHDLKVESSTVVTPKGYELVGSKRMVARLSTVAWNVYE